VTKSEEARIVNIAGSRRAVVAWLAVAMMGTAAMTTTAGAQNFGSPQQRWFRLEWTVSGGAAPRRITGWIYNDYGTSAGEVQLLVEARDRADTIVARRYQWLPGSLSPLSRTYFDVRGLPVADSYRVTVHSFNIHESLGWF
jgi:hypothetical protein